jgi:hypothetical protein
MIWETLMNKLIGFALGTLVSFGAVTSAFANGAAPARLPDDGVEVIVVTAKRPAAPPADEPIEEIIVTAKRPTTVVTDRTPPAMPIVLPQLEIAAEPVAVKL